MVCYEGGSEVTKIPLYQVSLWSIFSSCYVGDTLDKTYMSESERTELRPVIGNQVQGLPKCLNSWFSSTWTVVEARAFLKGNIHTNSEKESTQISIIVLPYLDFGYGPEKSIYTLFMGTEGISLTSSPTREF